MPIIRICIGLLLCILFSCNQKKVTNKKNQLDGLENDKYQIMALLIEQLPPGPPPPPPPPPPGVYEKDTVAFNRYRDSIFKLDVNIAVIDKYVNFDKRRKYDDIEKEYQVLIDQLNFIEDRHQNKISVNNIPVKKNRKIIELKVSDNSRQLLLDDKIDFIIRFSEITFNEGRDKAILYSSAYNHPLSGSSDLYLLKKENGSWKIYKRITLAIS